MADPRHPIGPVVASLGERPDPVAEPARWVKPPTPAKSGNRVIEGCTAERVSAAGRTFMDKTGSY